MKDTELQTLVEQYAKDLANSDAAKRIVVLSTDWPEGFDQAKQQQSVQNMIAPIQHLITILESQYNLVKK